MKCSSCGTELKDVKSPCPVCGTIMEAKDDMDIIIASILEEDDYKPKFESVVSDLPTGDKSVAVKPSITSRNKSNGLKSNGKKPVNGNANGSRRNGGTTRVNRSSKAKLSDTIVDGFRYGLAAVIFLFTISMFFNWFTLGGNAVNYGMPRTEDITPFMYKAIRNNSVASLENYDGPIATFSAMDLYSFGRKATDIYGTVIGPSGAEITSIVGTVQRFYMQATILVLIINIVSILLILSFKKLQPVAIIRNLAVINALIIGMNYLSLYIPWFSMFAVKAKDILNQTDGYHQVSIVRTGIVFDDKAYKYEMFHERGFVFASVLLILWLVIGIILTEVKNRREEIAIDTGEIK